MMLKPLTSLAVVLFLIAVIAAQTPSRPGLNLGQVEDIGIGCGEAVYLTRSDLDNHRFLLVSPMDEATYINLDGKNVKMRLVAKSKYNEKEKVGDRSWKEYSGGNVRVRVEYVTTRVCDPQDEGCEVTYYKANVIVRRGKQERVVNGLAFFGC